MQNRFLLFLVSVAVPAVALASVSPEQSAFQSFDDIIRAELDEATADVEWNTADELFPDTGETSSTSHIDETRQERAGDFLSIVVGNQSLVLRDVPRLSWFAPYVRDIAQRRLVSGYADAQGKPLGLFGPADGVTVEQMAKVLVLASGMPLSECPAAPANLSASGSWSAPYIACAESRGWTVYTDPGKDVTKPATRTEVVVSVLQSHVVYPGARVGDFFKDVTASTEFAGFIERAKLDGIVSGYADAEGKPTGYFGPQDNVTRAEFAKILTLAQQVYAR